MMSIIKKIVIIFSILIITSLSVIADTYVKGYTRSDGTSVKGHYRSSPNGTVTDNYSYYGNTNPHTGKTGSNKYKDDPSSPYYEGGYSGGSSSYIGLKLPNSNIDYTKTLEIIANKNKLIYQIENKLSDRGYWFIDKNSTLDWNSERAIKSEQRKNNIPITGILDMATLEVLGISID